MPRQRDQMLPVSRGGEIGDLLFMNSAVIPIPQVAGSQPGTRCLQNPDYTIPDKPASRPERANPLSELARLGQSVWVDYLSRNLIRSGQLQRLIDSDAVSGVMSDPAILVRAVNSSDAYDADIERLARGGKPVEEIREMILVGDVQEAADVLLPIYDRTHKCDGYVSVGMSSHLARQTSATAAEARRLWKVVDRPNVLIQVPATLAGVSAARQLVAEGINVNMTLLFDLLRYREVLEAWISGLDRRVRQKTSIEGVACVVGSSLSRMDALVDPLLEQATAEEWNDRDRLWQLRGQAGVAHAKMAFLVLQRFLAGFRFTRLREAGAQPLRLLWASSTRSNPDYSDLKYVEPLIGANTIVSLPLDTLAAYRDHGHPALRIEDGLETAQRVHCDLLQLGLEWHEIAQRLEEEGIARLASAYDALLDAIKTKCREVLPSASHPQRVLPHRAHSTHASLPDIALDSALTLKTTT